MVKKLFQLILFFLVAMAIAYGGFYIYKKLKTPANPQVFKYFNSACNDYIEKNEDCFRIIEGWNNKEVAKYLADNNFFSSTDFLKTVGSNLKNYVAIYPFLADKPESADLEGYLFPDTYRIFKGATPNDVVKKMLANFGRKLTPDLSQEISRQKKSIFEILTLASILEKEVRNPADMKMVADIFYKRLEAGIALQSDATVNYITGKGLASPSYEDLKIDSPYNTYKYKGLIPTPIANPGLDAIKAAIYPTSNSYYYFLTTPDGTVIYSRTYDEHLKNKAIYLK